MRAILLSQSGPPENLVVADLPIPTATTTSVVVRIRATGVCYRDIVERRGGFAFAKRPVVPGHEWAGDIVEVGGDVTAFAIGDRVVNLHRAACGACPACSGGHESRCRRALEVFGLTIDGGYAEYVRAPVGCLVRLPDAVSYEHGCFLNCTAGVALRALRTVAAVAKGETVLITGASGGVGVHAVQVAKLLGAKVIAVTGNEAKVPMLESVGADTVIVSGPTEIHTKVKRSTGGQGVDVALDCVGEPTLNASLRSLQPGGRLVVVGNVTADRWEINAGYLILGELSVHGSAGANRSDLEQVLRWTAEGELRPMVHAIWDLACAAQAHHALESHGVTGRIVLRPDPPP